MVVKYEKNLKLVVLKCESGTKPCILVGRVLQHFPSEACDLSFGGGGLGLILELLPPNIEV